MKAVTHSTPFGVDSPISTRVCDAACAGFAVWTLCCHAVVAGGGGLRALIALYLAVALAAGGAALWARRRGWRPSGGTADFPLDSDAPRSAALRRARWAGLALAGAAAAGALQSGDPLVLWWAMVALLAGAAATFIVLEPPRRIAARCDSGLEIGLWSLAVACAIYALVAHRPDIDDAFYVNLAVAAVDRPELPLLASDTLHGRDDLPIHYPVYRLHSYEMLNGAIALLSGIPAIRVFHWVAAALAALLVPLCHAALFRLLTPRVWLWTTGALVAVLVAVGETHRWYGNFAFVRIWQGKGIFLFVFLPLVYTYAIRFASTPSARNWLLLAAAQIAGLGCTSSALWAAPLGAWAALACALRPSWRAARRLLLGALASGYVLAAGLLVKAAMSSHTPAAARAYETGEPLAAAFAIVLGRGALQVVAIAVIFVTWACCRRGLAQRFAIALPLAALLIPLQPYLDGWVREHVTGPLYWRAMWALPVPILIALVLVAPLQWNLRPWHGRAACALLVLAFTLFVPSTSGFGARNQVSIGLPALKVEPTPYRWAALLNEVAPRRRVVAPASISAWVPVFHDHAYPLMVRGYLQPNREAVGRIAYRDRFVMTQLMDGEIRHLEADAIFRRGLDLYDVSAVCLKNSAHAETLRGILRGANYRRRVQSLDYEIWVRD